MIIQNLLDDLGIIPNKDTEFENDPNLKQGQELMKFERGYQSSVEPTLKLLQTTTSPNLKSIIEGFKGETQNKPHSVVFRPQDTAGFDPTGGNPSTATGFDPTPPANKNISSDTNPTDSSSSQSTDCSSTMPSDLISKMQVINEVEKRYELASKRYKTYLNNLKNNDSEYYNTVLVNSDNKLTIRVYDKSVYDYIDNNTYTESTWETPMTCSKLVSDFKIKDGDWGKAKDLQPIKDKYNHWCREESNSLRVTDGIKLPDPSKKIKKNNVMSNMCPLTAPYAYGSPTQNDGGEPNAFCCSGPLRDNNTYCTGESAGRVGGGKEMLDHVITINKVKYPLKAWNGFAVGPSNPAGSTIGMTQENPYIPIGVSTALGGKYTISWFETDSSFKPADCPQGLIYLENVHESYMWGKTNQSAEQRKNWRGSWSDSQKKSGCFYISKNDKINLQRDIDNILGKIVIDITKNPDGGTTPGDSATAAGLGTNVNPGWMSKESWNSTSHKANKDDGICQSQYGAYLNNKKITNFDSPDDSNLELTSHVSPGSVANSLYQGGICSWTCIEGCPGYSNYGSMPNDKSKGVDTDKLFKTCSNNQCLPGKAWGTHTFTRTLYTSLVNFKKSLYNSSMINATALEELGGDAWTGAAPGTFGAEAGGKCEEGSVYTRGENSNIDYPGCPPGDWCCKRVNSGNSNINNKLQIETCQDMATAYGIWAQEKGKWQIGCDDSEGNIKKTWEDSKCFSDSTEWSGPDFSNTKLLYAGCNKSIRSKNGEQVASGTNWSEADQTKFQDILDSGKNLYKDLDYYPERLYINSFGYRQNVNTDSLTDLLNKLKNRCKTKDNNKYVSKEDACYGEGGESSISTVNQLITNYDNIFSNCVSEKNLNYIPNIKKTTQDYQKIGIPGVEAPGITAQSPESTTCPGSISIKNQELFKFKLSTTAGNIVKYNNKYYWIDIEGWSTLIGDGNDIANLKKSTQTRCLSYIGVQEGDSLLNWINNHDSDIEVDELPPSRPTTNDFGENESDINELICSSYDRSLFIDVQNAGSELASHASDIQELLNNSEQKNDCYDNSIKDTEMNLEGIITKVNKDMDKLDALRQIKDTNKARVESTTLIRESSKFQYLAWIVVGVILFLYGIFGFRSGNMSSPLHIGMLVACVIILFIILRRVYLSGII